MDSGSPIGTGPNISPFTSSDNKDSNQNAGLDTPSKNLSHEASSLATVWSENPTNPNWHVKLVLHSIDPEDFEQRIGFIILSVVDEKKRKEEAFTKLVKFNSIYRADAMDTQTFQKLLKKGDSFTKLELCGAFFNNVNICPSFHTPDSRVPLLNIPNLRHLILKPKISIALKGTDKSSQESYYQIHKAFFESMKDRVSRNMWYVMKAFNCPKLIKLEVQDCVDWECCESNSLESYEVFRYWESPMFQFLQRHSQTLKALKVSPIPLSSHIDQDVKDVPIPSLKELLFCPRISLRLDSPLSQRSKIHSDGSLNKMIDKQLEPWRRILQFQKELKSIGWICDARNPFPITRRDFTRLCEENPQAESLMLVMHGDEMLRRQLNAQEIPPFTSMNNFNINCALIHGMTSLKVLSIGCCSNDTQMRNFTLFNLHLLPLSLETVHLSGIRVTALELENLSQLKNLKTLTIFQDNVVLRDSRDDNDEDRNAEGVTVTVLKQLINMRSLNQLVIMGFPALMKDSMEPNSSHAFSNSVEGGLCSLFGCGGFMMSKQSASVLDQKKKARSGESVLTHQPGSCSIETQERSKTSLQRLQTLLKSLMIVAKISEVETNLSAEAHANITLLSLGKYEEFPLINYLN